MISFFGVLVLLSKYLSDCLPSIVSFGNLCNFYLLSTDVPVFINDTLTTNVNVAVVDLMIVERKIEETFHVLSSQ